MNPTVHPAIIVMSRERAARSCGVSAGCESSSHSGSWAWHCGSADFEGGGGPGGGPFGVRRPLRFLAYKLELDDAQITKLAEILSELKTERAQAAVDDRRALAAFADAVAAETFDAAKAGEGASMRARGAEQLSRTVVAALGRIHALLSPEQRSRFAYLIRTGTVLL